MIDRRHKDNIKERLEEATSQKELIAIVEEVERAYGNCQNCYGKGYSTLSGAITVSSDFPDSEPITRKRIDLPTRMQFCDCGRGKQLRELLES